MGKMVCFVNCGFLLKRAECKVAIHFICQCGVWVNKVIHFGGCRCFDGGSYIVWMQGLGLT